MRLLLAAAALSLAVPTYAADTPAATQVQPKSAKPKKICRETEARTGSHMAGGRVCRTAEKWFELDQAEADTTTIAHGNPTHSGAKSDN